MSDDERAIVGAGRGHLLTGPHSEAQPYTKEMQLGRGERRRPRKRANSAGWERIAEWKRGPCRVCVNASSNGHDYGTIQFHHVVPRDWLGDDVPENIVPLHEACHRAVTHLHAPSCKAMLASLTDAEYAYAVGKVGEGFAERIYGVEYERA